MMTLSAIIGDLQEWDSHWFHFFNQSLSNKIMDIILPVWREKTTWIPLYLVLVWLLWKQLGKYGIILIFGTIAVTGLSDTVSSKVIKPAVQRIRPCRALPPEQEVAIRIPCGTGYSFPSSHAANHFALAAFLAITWARRRKGLQSALYLWAASIALAQVYVGVHYPFDVLAGAVLGLIIGLPAGLFCRQKWEPDNPQV